MKARANALPPNPAYWRYVSLPNQVIPQNHYQTKHNKTYCRSLFDVGQQGFIASHKNMGIGMNLDMYV